MTEVSRPAEPDLQTGFRNRGQPWRVTFSILKQSMWAKTSTSRSSCAIPAIQCFTTSRCGWRFPGQLSHRDGGSVVFDAGDLEVSGRNQTVLKMSAKQAGEAVNVLQVGRHRAGRRTRSRPNGCGRTQ